MTDRHWRENGREPLRMSLVATPTAALAAALLLAACAATPTASVTATLTEGATTIQMVVKSDDTAVAAIEAKPYANDPTFGAVMFSNGDTHTGPHVCGFNVSTSQHTYQVDFYGNIKPGAAGEVCSAADQTHFLATAP